MNSGTSEEESESKKQYVFFSDPNVIIRRAETVATSQAQQLFQLQQQQEQSRNAKIVDNPRNLKTLENLLESNPVPPHPFTFITAVKRKLALGGYPAFKKAYDPDQDVKETNKNCKHNPKQSTSKMNYIKPLKVPDLKISPKTLDYSSRDSSSAHEDISRMMQKDERVSKSTDRVQRKLDFSHSSASSILNSENIEPLITPDISICSSLNKKKDHSRDRSKEKENRSKKIKRDDFSLMKGSDELSRSRNFKHISRKDEADSIVSKMKSDIPQRRFKDADVAAKKLKNKSFITSTVRKEEDRRYRQPVAQSLPKFTRDKLQGRSLSNDSNSTSGRSIKSNDNITLRDYRSVLHDDLKYKTSSQKQPGKSNFKENNKKVPEKLKSGSAKSDLRSNIPRDISEDIDTSSDVVKHEKNKKIDDSSSSHIIASISTQDESNTKDSRLDMLLDPIRIGLRDANNSPQLEFNELNTPDVNSLFRMKKRRQILQEEANAAGRRKDDETQMLHPTALHMQFQAELNLLDSFNESLRQVRDVENCLYKDKELMQKQSNAPSNVVDNKPSESIKRHDTHSSHDVENNGSKTNKPVIKVAEVQTQTANDMATQTETSFCRHTKFDDVPSLSYRNSLSMHDMAPFSAESMDQSADLERLEDMSFPNKMRTMSEISLHETTSSIKTETGTEISISTRDITYSFNKYLDLEMAQLIKDEKQRYDKIEMLFKSREKTLNDRTKKIVKLEEQKRALRDAGQDSQISSVKKKQRALLLKLQQEKDEMNRLKELHKIASQERKIMLQKQRDMFNPEMSTKNILTKLKRSADTQSPRRLSGPMKGYDIRSNSSMSSLVDSDRSQLDRSQIDCLQKDPSLKLPKLDAFEKPDYLSSQEEVVKPKYDIKSRKFEDKMPSPRSDITKLKEILDQKSDSAKESDKAVDSDTLVEELLLNIHKSKSRGEKLLIDKEKDKKATHCTDAKTSSKRKGSRSQKTKPNVDGSCKFLHEEATTRHHGKRSKIESSDENYQNSILEEVDLNESQSSLQALIKHSRDVKERNYQLLREIANEQEGVSSRAAAKSESEHRMENDDARNLGNVSARSQVSTFTISRHSSADSERSFSRSVVIRAHDPRFKNSKKLEQILNAREAALASRRSCVEEWIAWHAKLREEENRVARMEQAALKLVTAASNALSYHGNDTTVSSDTSDVEGRIEELTKKLADRRLEMTRLKKEARRQVKQRLRALEANLLNQIKKYDTTIDEMRKKLETKKSFVKDSEKLAIEAKSVIDFKVPEIPIKRIQDIYKSSDLLRSKSEPMLTPTEPKVESILRSIVTTDDQSKISHSHKSSDEHVQSTGNNNYLTSDSEEVLTQPSDTSEKQTSKTSVSPSSHASEDAPSEINNVRTPTFFDTSLSKSEKVDSLEKSDKTEVLDETSACVQSVESIPLQNKMISENMITLENDLRSLTEMMSDFSKKSHAKLKLVREARIFDDLTKNESEKSTTKEISEELSEDKLTSSKQDLELSKKNSTTDVPVTSISNQSTDIEAQSKEILNEIEKSIISDKIKPHEQEPQTSQLTFEVGMQNLYKENEALSKDLNSLEADLESLSAMISKVSRNKSSDEIISIETEVRSQTKDDESIQEEISLDINSEESENKGESDLSRKSNSELIETAVDTPRDENFKNESSTVMPEEEITNEEEVDIDSNQKSSSSSGSSKRIVRDIIEESVASLQDLKETDVDSSHEFDASQHDLDIKLTISKPNEVQDDKYLVDEIDTIKSKDDGEEEISEEFDEVSSFHFKNESYKIDGETNESSLCQRFESETDKKVLHDNKMLEQQSMQENECEVDADSDIKKKDTEESKADILETSSQQLGNNMLDLISMKIDEEDESSKIEPSEHLVISEMKSDSSEDQNLPLLVIDATIRVVEDNEEKEENHTSEYLKDDSSPLEEQDEPSSDGEQLDNLIEVAESQIATVEKDAVFNISVSFEKINESKNGLELQTPLENESEVAKIKNTIDKSSDVIRDSEYSDISEESYEVNEIMERSETKKRPRVTTLIEKCEVQTLETDKETQKSEENVISETSEGFDTPRGVAEIEMDSPRYVKDQKLEIVELGTQEETGLAVKDLRKNEYHSPTLVSTSEKNIEAMIDKLKASLEQPNIEVAELEATLLRIEELQLELEIKKLEAEEVSYYVREIPNKPPPPYTPPSTGKVVTSQSSPSPPPAVVPSNIEELTAFTGKATRIIYNALQIGKDIASLEVPSEICELSKDNNEVARRDRRIYNTFLFDLCKEITYNVYHSDYEKPGPSWTKLDVHVKAAVKRPQSAEELHEYVNKEVALLFGFKTKLQRENMVMRWSRKRRDRVDELLAREAQVEEDEWTKFHQDELTVKNDLTVAILDTLLMETASIVKNAYAKKRRIVI